MDGSYAYAVPQMAYAATPQSQSYPALMTDYRGYYASPPPTLTAGTLQYGGHYYPSYGFYAQAPSPDTLSYLASTYQQEQTRQWEKQYHEWSSLYTPKKKPPEPSATTSTEGKKDNASSQQPEKPIGPNLGDNKPYLIMKNMGFVKGKGLGKELQGSLEAPVIKVQKSKSGLGFEKPEKLGLVKCILCDKVFNNTDQLVLHEASKKHRAATRKQHQSPKPGYEMLHLFRATTEQQRTDSANGIFICMPCDLPFNGVASARNHFISVRHEPLKVAGQYSCEICGLALNSEFQLNEHCSSKKHTKKAEKLAQQPPSSFLVDSKNDSPTSAITTTTTSNVTINSTPPTTPVERKDLTIGKGPYHCEVCDVSFNSLAQQQQHVIGKKHSKAVNRSHHNPVEPSPTTNTAPNSTTSLNQEHINSTPAQEKTERKRKLHRRKRDSLKRGRQGQPGWDQPECYEDEDLVDDGILIDEIDEWGRPIFIDPMAFLNNIHSSLYVNVLIEPTPSQQQTLTHNQPPTQQTPQPQSPQPSQQSTQPVQTQPQQPQPVLSQPPHSQATLPTMDTRPFNPQDVYMSPPYAEPSPAVFPSSVPSYCSLCDKQFNSESQSRQHFASKVHNKKVVASMNGALPPINALQKPVLFTKAH